MVSYLKIRLTDDSFGVDMMQTLLNITGGHYAASLRSLCSLRSPHDPRRFSVKSSLPGPLAVGAVGPPISLHVAIVKAWEQGSRGAVSGREEPQGQGPGGGMESGRLPIEV